VASLPGVDAVEPPHDPPLEGIHLGRVAGINDRGDSDRKRAEARQGAQLGRKPPAGITEARQPDDELASQPVQGVVGASAGKPVKRQSSELGKLELEERPHNVWTRVRTIVLERHDHAEGLVVSEVRARNRSTKLREAHDP
jgi:hypothetical protein